MEHLKRLEGEVLELLTELGDPQLEAEMREFKVRPHQFIGLEINPWAVPIAELVLWIGYLQWHFRTSDKAVPDDPVISKEHSIRLQDAVLAYDRKKMITWAMARENPDLPGLPDEVREKLRRNRGDEAPAAKSEVRSAKSEGEQFPSPNSGLPPLTAPVSVWDGRTMKRHPVAGKDVPDETARVPLWRYVNPRQADWPEADYVVGNPPFIGNKRMRATLGDGYAETLRGAYGDLPESCDFVVYWWHIAATRLSRGSLRRFGFICTNSLTQPFNRSAVAKFLTGEPPISLVFAIPDHPWVDSADGAAVRISMTVAEQGVRSGEFYEVLQESPGSDLERAITLEKKSGIIHANLSVGAHVGDIVALEANAGISNQGVTPLGTGFRLERSDLRRLGLDPDSLPSVIKPYLIGRDLVQRPEEKYIIDFFGHSEQQAKSNYPELMQIVIDSVRPEREQKKRDSYREKWWTFAEPRSMLRPALDSIRRYIATCRTAKHRLFTFVPSRTLPDAKVVAIGLADPFFLGVLSSSIHQRWTLKTGALLEDRPNYNHSDCFVKFPFPSPDDATRERIRSLGEQLDAHRKRQQALHPGLTLTGMYNVLEKLRSGGALTAKEKVIHEQGLVSVLRQIHDDLDAVVFAAYQWPATLSDEEILERLVALNHQRAEEEKRGHIRWLRPDFQCRDRQQQAVQTELEADEDGESPKSEVRSPKTDAPQPWPKPLAEQVEAVRRVLSAAGGPVTAAEVAARFQRASKDRVAEILETLLALGKARQVDVGKFQA